MTALVAAFVLLGINGFFVLAEFALVRIRKTRLEELAQRGDNRASLALKMLGRMDSYLSAVQLGVTLASLGLGWLGEPAVAAYIEPFVFQYFPGSTIVLRSVSLLLSFFIVTFVTVVIGELIPKNVAMQRRKPFCCGLFGRYTFFINWVGPSSLYLTGQRVFC